MLAGLGEDALIVLVLVLHVSLTPFTKVEESFNLHATHDILLHGIAPAALKHYDHFVFPGVVPRSFVGSLLLAAAVWPPMQLGLHLGYLTSKLQIQLLARSALALVNALSICFFRGVVARRFGRGTSFIFTVLSITQYHIPFWAGRTIPNMFAFAPVTCALALLLERDTLSPKNQRRIIALLTAAGVVLRAELALLVAPVALHLVLFRRASFLLIVRTGLWTALLSVALTVVIDSYFWDTWPLWPELNSIIFNVLEGRNVEWGISPIHSYFSAFIPRMLLGALPPAIIGLIRDSPTRNAIYPCLVFVAMLSFLGHKEWRFVVYVLPILNVAASRGVLFLLRLRGPRLKTVAAMSLAGLLIANVAITIAFTFVSTLNYPGGHALNATHFLLGGFREPVHLHIDNLSAQTGASLFLHSNALPPFPPGRSPRYFWEYDKTESIREYHGFTHILTDNLNGIFQANHSAEIRAKREYVDTLPISLVRTAQERQDSSAEWRILAHILAYDGWGRSTDPGRWWKPLIPLPRLAPKIWLLEYTNSRVP